jgi:hypothetical protein
MKKKSRPRFNMRSAKHQAAMIDMLATMIAGVMVRHFAKSESKPKQKIRKQYAKKKAR